MELVVSMSGESVTVFSSANAELLSDRMNEDQERSADSLFLLMIDSAEEKLFPTLKDFRESDIVAYAMDAYANIASIAVVSYKIMSNLCLLYTSPSPRDS
eukprot:TRINITY_DN8051_c0_g1_i1.p2 TRINITY_DN8051_c0_g1~~TRINITY_DN8051_c0_g1_i1.p2  ORF type:complete len:100 (+),score=5.39 TRINITY_DN8051_c0_g1_i1:727-1026(+)